MLLDVKKAFLYGEIKRRVYIELPEEDVHREGGKYVGKLNKAMYGLRDAPQVWQMEVRRILGGHGLYRINHCAVCLLSTTYWNSTCYACRRFSVHRARSTFEGIL